MDPVKKLAEVSDIQVNEEGNVTFMQTRINVFEDGSKRVLGSGRVALLNAEGQPVKEASQDDAVNFEKGRVDADIEVVYSDKTTVAQNEAGDVAPEVVG